MCISRRILCFTVYFFCFILSFFIILAYKDVGLIELLPIIPLIFGFDSVKCLLSSRINGRKKTKAERFLFYLGSLIPYLNMLWIGFNSLIIARDVSKLGGDNKVSAKKYLFHIFLFLFLYYVNLAYFKYDSFFVVLILNSMSSLYLKFPDICIAEALILAWFMVYYLFVFVFVGEGTIYDFLILYWLCNAIITRMYLSVENEKETRGGRSI